MRTPVVPTLCAVVAAAAALAGCLATRYSDRVYLYQRPVQDSGNRAVAISEPDWAACDRDADRVATAQYQDARIRQAVAADAGGLQGAVLFVAAAVTTRGKPEPEALRRQRERTYEERMRHCLGGRGYPLETPAPAFAGPSPSPPLDPERRPAPETARH